MTVRFLFLFLNLTSADVNTAVPILGMGGMQWGRDNKCLLFKWLLGVTLYEAIEN